MKDKVKKKFIKFFSERNGHTFVKSSSLLPHSDPSILFTTAGMLQFKPFFLKERIPEYSKAISIQKCLRTTDLDNVGYSNFHNTFFEMLGNFSFNSYFKKEAFQLAIDFIEYIGLSFNKISFSVYEKDIETYKILLSLKVPKDKIFFLGEEDNFWGPPGKDGVCGPCSEIYYEYNGTKFELWNIVFIKYFKDIDGNFTSLNEYYVDTGMGLERLLMILENKNSVYETSIFQSIILEIEKILNYKYNFNKKIQTIYHIIADHIRALVFILSENILPSNEGRGYIIRKILRRAIRVSQPIIKDPFLYKLVDFVIQEMKSDYPELENQNLKISNIIQMEESLFKKTLQDGSSYLNKIIEKSKDLKKSCISGETIFFLYDSLGFPLEIIREILLSKDLSFDEKEFNNLMNHQKKQGEKSWKGESTSILKFFLEKKIEKTTYFEILLTQNITSKIVFILKKDKKNYFPVDSLKKDEEGILILSITSFYAEGGGQIYDIGTISKDNSRYRVDNVQNKNGFYLHYGTVLSGELIKSDNVFLNIDLQRKINISKNHSATHLLHHFILNDLNSKQMGSFVEDSRLRFDFSYYKALSEKEIYELEYKVNTLIQKNYTRKTELIKKEQINEKGAIAFFNENYGSIVRTIQFGPSIELCGGTHVTSTGQIGYIKIIGQSSVGKGIRRLEAITGFYAFHKFSKIFDVYSHIKKIFHQSENLIPFLSNIKDSMNKLSKENLDLKQKILFYTMQSEIERFSFSNNILFLFFNSKKIMNLRLLYNQVSKSIKSYSLYFFVCHQNDSLLYLLAISPNIPLNDSIQPILNEVKDKIGITKNISFEKSNIIQGKGSYDSGKIKSLKDFILSYLKKIPIS